MKRLLNFLFIIVAVQSTFLAAMENTVTAPQLPKEIIAQIAGLLRPRDKNTFMRVSKFFEACVKDRALIVQANPSTVSLADKKEDMFMYTYANNIPMMKFLLANGGVKADVKNLLGMTLFHIASDHGNVEAMSLLVDHGADVKVLKPQMQPLHEAVYKGDEKTVKALLNLKVDPNIVFEKGMTPLMIAICKGYITIVESLLYAGAEVDQAVNGSTPLFDAAYYGHTEIAELLINAHANVNFATKNGCTSLYVAAQNGHTDIVQLLIDAHANVNLASNLPLCVASYYGHVEIVRLLLNAGAKVNYKSDGWTPLCAASYNGSVECVTLLLAHRADIYQAIDSTNDPVIKKGDTALQIAQKKGHIEVVEILQEHLQREKKNDCTIVKTTSKKKTENCAVQ